MQRKPTVVFVTHSIEEAVQLSTSVCVITPRPGRIDRMIDIDLPWPRDLEVKNSPALRTHCPSTSRGFSMTMASSSKLAEPDRWHAATGPRDLARGVERSWLFIAFFVGLFLVWECSVDCSRIPAYILPKPSEIVTKGWADIPRLLDYTSVTGLETLLGYVVAIVLGCRSGLRSPSRSILRRTIYPFFVSLEMVPKIAFAPLFISWLGFGLLPKVIIVVLVCFFPIVLNAILRLRLAERRTDALLPIDRRRAAARLPEGAAAGSAAAMLRRLQVCRAQRHGRRDDRRVHRQRPRPRLLHSDRHRQHAARSRLRRHLPPDALGLALFGCVTLAERLLIPWHISVRRH